MGKSAGITGIRLREVMAQRGKDQADVAAAVGISQSAMSQIIGGVTRNSRHLPAIAEYLSVNLAYLRGSTDEKFDLLSDAGERLTEEELVKAGLNLVQGSGTSATAEQRLAFLAEHTRPDPDVVEVAEIDLRYGMGATDLDVPFTMSKRQFSRAWLRQYTSARPEDLVWAQGIGDSMSPTILDSDGLLIDLTEKSIRISDKIWALAFGSAGMVKRLRPMPDGSVKILSDRDGIPEERAHDDEVHLIGRVVAIVRKM